MADARRKPDDYVIATGETHTVREFAERALQSWAWIIGTMSPDPELFRPAEVNLLLGDASKAKKKLKWWHAMAFDALVREMVEADCRAWEWSPGNRARGKKLGVEARMQSYSDA